ncbi:preprotein translocase subunit SecA [Candidatus Microgenomates bacterium]|nr:preprotein translocase subunit SecA [Candidatus Microgenomates bacterium]
MFKFLGSLLDSNERELKKIAPVIEKISSVEDKIKKLSDITLAKKTAEFKNRLESGETVDSLLVEAFAVVREAARRTLAQRHFDVQLIASFVLHQGKIAEQKTGEGKTLSATPTLYLNALKGKGVHLVTVNDYLARRDAGWMGPIFHLLGLSNSAIIHDQSFLYDPSYSDKNVSDSRLVHLRPISRKEAYAADITYGINSEFGFDYLRDNMAGSLDDVVQRGANFAIVDEVDSVLIDEARTPHIISAPDAEPTQKYYEYARIVSQLTPKLDFEVDEKLHTAHLTEHGIAKIEKLYGIANIYERDFQTVHHLEAALKARTLYQRDKEYVIRDGQIIIVDEFTGRLMPGRRFSEGIHQALEAKEGVAIQRESKTLASVSLQNYFRMYEKLAGMTGTAATEAEEFHKIYNLEVVVIPTHKPMIRKDQADVVYKTTRAKYAAVVREIEECYKRGQPVLVGTTSIDKNEIISQFLRRKGIPHNMLNAKNHQKEAEFIANAGKKGTVTVATNMAGRGVDIILGGVPDAQEKWQKAHDEVVGLGGLHVIGTERHESRRIDNQLRGRSGRQGDPGSSHFFVSLEDEIMRLFGGDRIAGLMTMFKLPEDQPLTHAMVSRAIEQAQSKVEGFNFDIRKHLVEYDDVMNKQRQIIYAFRRRVLEKSEDLKEKILEKIEQEVSSLVTIHVGDSVSQDGLGMVVGEFSTIIPFDENSQQQLLKQIEQMQSQEETTKLLTTIALDLYQQREKQVSVEVMRQVEQWVMRTVIDTLWMEHLDAIDDLREGIGLRGYAQKDPLVEYKNEAFSMFEKLMAAIDSEIVHRIYKIQIQQTPQPEVARAQRLEVSREVDVKKKLGRNDPCHCGAVDADGKPYKYKKCGLINAPYHKG